MLFVLVWGVCITYFGSLTKFLDSFLDYWLFDSFSHLLCISFISLVGLSLVFCSVLCQFSLLVVLLLFLVSELHVNKTDTDAFTPTFSSLLQLGCYTL